MEKKKTVIPFFPEIITFSSEIRKKSQISYIMRKLIKKNEVIGKFLYDCYHDIIIDYH